ncbi:hypothetical protein V6N11_026020 [Hibiscus sabdariffa]|uniref:Uncharacterized protein n=1 Tax=Hibiscus sabdariffa TaxID=183260 RepID=A0ABR2SV79_9ROSI
MIVERKKHNSRPQTSANRSGKDNEHIFPHSNPFFEDLVKVDLHTDFSANYGDIIDESIYMNIPLLNDPIVDAPILAQFMLLIPRVNDNLMVCDVALSNVTWNLIALNKHLLSIAIQHILNVPPPTANLGSNRFDSLYDICGNADESSLHILRDCLMTRNLWDALIHFQQLPNFFSA